MLCVSAVWTQSRELPAPIAAQDQGAAGAVLLVRYGGEHCWILSLQLCAAPLHGGLRVAKVVLVLFVFVSCASDGPAVASLAWCAVGFRSVGVLPGVACQFSCLVVSS